MYLNGRIMLGALSVAKMYLNGDALSVAKMSLNDRNMQGLGFRV